MACGLRSATHDGKETDVANFTNVLFKAGDEHIPIRIYSLEYTMEVVIRHLPERDRDVPDVLQNTYKFSKYQHPGPSIRTRKERHSQRTLCGAEGSVYNILSHGR